MQIDELIEADGLIATAVEMGDGFRFHVDGRIEIRVRVRSETKSLLP